jgi:uncharacterized protein GlcG (DUF336 family)
MRLHRFPPEEKLDPAYVGSFFLHAHFSLAPDQIQAQILVALPRNAVSLCCTHILQSEGVMIGISLEQANEIIREAFTRAQEMGIPPVTVVVLDDGGHLKAAQRQDGATMFRFDVAMGKAWGAVGMGASSRVAAERAKGNPNFFITLAASAHGKFLPQPGAVLIRDAAGNAIGAAGASGGTGEEDEEICAYGIRKAGLVADLPDA